jgi:hypothetical protein
MAIDETARFELQQAVRESLGESEGDDLMSLLPPVGWADVATKQDLSRELERLEARLIAQFHREMTRQIWAILGWLTAVIAIVTANDIW